VSTFLGSSCSRWRSLPTSPARLSGLMAASLRGPYGKLWAQTARCPWPVAAGGAPATEPGMLGELVAEPADGGPCDQRAPRVVNRKVIESAPRTISDRELRIT